MAYVWRMYDIETLSTDRVLKIRNIFMEKSCRKYTSKAGLRTLLYVGH